MSIKQTKSNHEQHAFSYIIIQKHTPPSNETSTWSRIVDQPSKRGQHVILNTCTSRGKIERMVIPKSQGKGEFRDARKSRWGDLFPHDAKNGTQEVKLKPEEFKYRNRRYDHVEFIDEDDD
jgi:ribosomal protein RSM22 (predicted rRNA methylase)